MRVRALLSFSGSGFSPAKGQVFEIKDLTVAQDLIAAGYVVEVESCPTCGSTVDKA